MKTIAIIPARKGSKGVPRKNTIPLLGKPLISYTIEAALKSQHVSGIIVSSDDEKVLDIVSQFKKVEFHLRPDSLASDTSPISDTIEDVLSKFSIANEADYLMLLQPTAPLRTEKNIDDAIQLMVENPAFNSLVSVCEMQDMHPGRMYWKEDKILTPIMNSYEHLRRQDIPVAYYRNGSIYIVKKEIFCLKKQVIVTPTGAYIMPYAWLLNIDEKRDVIIAESIMKAWFEGQL